MEVKIFFIESHKDFSAAEKKRVAAITQKAFSKTAELLGITSVVNVTYYRFGKKIGGFAQAKDWVRMTVPNDRIDYADLEAKLYHEFHHTVRGYAGYLKKGQPKHHLLNSLFSEGLATAYELDMEPKGRKSSHGSYTKALVEKWLPQTKKELFDTKHYDYLGWFHGEGRPKHLGYKLGKYLYDEIKKRHPDLTHKYLVKKNAKALLKLSGVKV